MSLQNPIAFRFCLVIAIFLLVPIENFATSADTEDCVRPNGDAVIRKRARESEIVITTTSRLAGAIHSLTWNGKEFIDSFDHGRQLQSASNFDSGTKFYSETFNPTEAGSRDDGAGPESSSQLLQLIANGDELQTTTQMAFWLAPGEKSAGHPAKNSKILSNHLLTKRVRIGYDDLPQVIEYSVTFSVPIGEKHRYAQFEALTGYMPEEFGEFWKFNPKTEKLEPLSSGPGEQAQPVVLASKDGAYAMGIMTPEQQEPHQPPIGYGRFRFPAAHVVKWNCVFRIRNPHGIPAADYHYRMFVIVGDLSTVESSLRSLYHKFQN